MALVIYSADTGELRRIVQNSIGESQTNDHLASVHPPQEDELLVFALDKADLEYYIDIAEKAHRLATQ